jgi:hypothetical protein
MTLPFWLNFAIKSALFYGGWIYCVQSVKDCDPFNGTALISAILAYLFLVSNNRIADLVLVLSITVFGALTDSIYALTGMIIYKCTYATIPWIAPYWIVSLWMLFAALIRESFAWLYGRWWMATLLGSAGGVSSYLAAMRMGAAEFGVGALYGIIVLAIVWAIIVPLTVFYSRWIDRMTQVVGKDNKDLKDPKDTN